MTSSNPIDNERRKRSEFERAKNPLNPEFYEYLAKGIKGGIDVAPQERHAMLRHMRDVQGQDEAPKIHYVLGNNPILDMGRQIKAVNPEGLAARLFPGLAGYDDQELVQRANAGYIYGPHLRPEEQLSFDPTQAELAAYKQRLRELPAVSKAGYALGALGQDFINNASRNLWWLINAPQAVVDLASEGVANQFNPNLRSID